MSLLHITTIYMFFQGSYCNLKICKNYATLNPFIFWWNFRINFFFQFSQIQQLLLWKNIYFLKIYWLHVCFGIHQKLNHFGEKTQHFSWGPSWWAKLEVAVQVLWKNSFQMSLIKYATEGAMSSFFFKVLSSVLFLNLDWTEFLENFYFAQKIKGYIFTV